MACALHFVLDAKFLTFERSYPIFVGVRAAIFFVYLVFQYRVALPKGSNAFLQAHGNLPSLRCTKEL